MAFRFRKFRVYQDAKSLHKELIKIVNIIPPKNIGAIYLILTVNAVLLFDADCTIIEESNFIPNIFP